MSRAMAPSSRRAFDPIDHERLRLEQTIPGSGPENANPSAAQWYVRRTHPNRNPACDQNDFATSSTTLFIARFFQCADDVVLEASVERDTALLPLSLLVCLDRKSPQIIASNVETRQCPRRKGIGLVSANEGIHHLLPSIVYPRPA